MNKIGKIKLVKMYQDFIDQQWSLEDKNFLLYSVEQLQKIYPNMKKETIINKKCLIFKELDNFIRSQK